MSSQIVSFLFLIASILSLVTAGRDFQFKCKGSLMHKVDELYDAREACVKDGVNDLMCQAICGAKKVDVLSEPYGNINMTGIASRIKYHVPEPAGAADSIIKAVEVCYKTYEPLVTRNAGAMDLSTVQPFCSSRYIGFWTCMWASAMIHCGAEWDPELIGSKEITMKSKI